MHLQLAFPCLFVMCTLVFLAFWLHGGKPLVHIFPELAVLFSNVGKSAWTDIATTFQWNFQSYPTSQQILECSRMF